MEIEERAQLLGKLEAALSDLKEADDLIEELKSLSNVATFALAEKESALQRVYHVHKDCKTDCPTLKALEGEQ